jgi:hypothetical protein
MGLYSSNCRRFFVCRTVNWEPLGQFTTIRLSIPITMQSLKWIGHGVLNLQRDILYNLMNRRFFVCRAVIWEPLGQFTSNFAQLLELIVLRSVYFLVKFQFFIPELWDFILQIVRDFKAIFHMSRCKLRTPWPIHFKLRIVLGIDSLMVCILFVP